MSRSLNTRLLFGLFFFSGAAALGYQVVWAKWFAVGLGHEFPSVVAVVSAFMAGMALGAIWFDRRIRSSSRPGIWYCCLEGTIGIWAIATIYLLPLSNHLATTLIGIHPHPLFQAAVAFGLTSLVLAPATIALGATLPAMERIIAGRKGEDRVIGGVYGANTIGAATGIVMAAFYLIPAFGLDRSILILGALNLVIGAFAWLLLRSTSVAPKLKTNEPRIPLPTGRLGAVAFFSGLLGMSYELTGIRALAQILDNTVYTFAAVLSVYLIGTACGAASYQRFLRNWSSRNVLSLFLIGLSSACLLGVIALNYASSLHRTVQTSLGHGISATAISEIVVSATVFFLPTLFMGIILSFILQITVTSDRGVGTFYAINTLGGALAGPLVSALLLPLAGIKWSLAIIALAYSALAPEWPPVTRRAALIPGALFMLLPAFGPWIDTGKDETVIAYREGSLASVAVTETPDGNRTLRVNTRFQMGGTAVEIAQRRQGHLPLLLHPAPKRVLFLGVGTGSSVAAARDHSGLTADAVELVPEILELMNYFRSKESPSSARDSVTFFSADARRFVTASHSKYDVVIGDVFHPARDGSGFLYTREHFDAIRKTLNPGGLYCQWLPLHQLNSPTLKSIVGTFLEVYPDASAWLLRFNVDAPVIGLVGGTGGSIPDPGALDPQRFERMKGALNRVSLNSPIRLLGCRLMDESALARLAGNAPLNTDTHPRVVFTAPRLGAPGDRKPVERVLNLLAFSEATPAGHSRVAAEEETVIAERDRAVADFVRARNLYLMGLAAEAEEGMEAAVELFLKSTEASNEFTSGYSRCITIAVAWSRTRKEAALDLLDRLIELRPTTGLAIQLRARLSP